MQTAVPSPLVGATEKPQLSSPRQNSPAASTLYYVSDYFWFVGKNAQGHAAFALDTNRGRDGEPWQAEHFVVLHDEGHGWIDVQGNGFFSNVNHES